MARARYDNVLTEDEFHPDPRVAARHADVNALRYSISYYQSSIKKLEAMPQRSREQDEYLDRHRMALEDALCRLEDYEQEDEE